MSNLPVGVLLAAGKGRRFGGNKLLHPVADGTPMLLASAKTLASALPDTVTVINQDLKFYAAQLEQLGMRVVINNEAEKGMGSSVACGVKASEDATGWLIALADMPYIKTETISQLANEMTRGAEIVAPSYAGRRGHPVGFSAHCKDELLALNTDVGARHIIEAHREQLALLETDDEGVITDIDHRV